jgi:hypothetical protein
MLYVFFGCGNLITKAIWNFFHCAQVAAFQVKDIFASVPKS